MLPPFVLLADGPQLVDPSGGSQPAGGNSTGPSTTQSAGGTNTGGGGPRPGIGDMLMNFAPMILIFVVLYFFLFRGQRKEQKRLKAQLASMKKGDEVLLISGKFGKVIDIKDDRVVVKVDEANNVKETYLKSAIQKVIEGGDTK